MKTYHSKPIPVLQFMALAMSVAFSMPAQGAGDAHDDIEDYVVTAARTPQPAYQVGNAHSLLDAQTIERRQVPLVSDLLRSVPGVAVSRGGGVGQLGQVRIRGAEGNHTLVLIDGIEANELTNASEFDFSTLLAAGIERIEVLRGAQSALYGAEAIGGVINIITRSGQPGFRGFLRGEGGSFGTGQFSAGVSGGNARITGALTANYYRTRGINNSRFGNERDGHEATSLHGKLRLQAADNLIIDAVVRYHESETEFDGQDFAFPPTPTQGLVIDTDDEQDLKQLFVLGRATLELMDGRWRHEASVSYGDTEREFFDTGVFVSGSMGDRLKVSYQTSIQFGRSNDANVSHVVTAAVEHEDLDFANFGALPTSLETASHSDRQTSFVAEYQLGIADQFFITGGVRHDDNRHFKNATTWRLAAVWRNTTWGTRVHGSAGTGIAHPGFFELFGFFPDFFVGNPDLKPERSTSFDFGIEQALFGDRLVVDVTYFHADLEDEIVSTFDFDTFLSSVDNLEGESKRKGVEVMLSALLGDNLRASGSYTYTRSRQPDGQIEARRPKHTGSVSLSYSFPGGGGHVTLSADYHGKQEDNEFVFATPESRVVLDDYVLVGLAAAWNITRNIELFGRLENAFDDDYEEVFSFRSPGFGAYAGVKVKLGD